MTQSEPAKTHFIYTISKEKHLNTKYKVVCVCACACVRTFVFSAAEVRGVRLIGGLPRGVSSLVEFALWPGRMWQLRGVTLWCLWSGWGRLTTHVYSDQNSYSTLRFDVVTESQSPQTQWKMSLLQHVSECCPDLLLNSVPLSSQLLMHLKS